MGNKSTQRTQLVFHAQLFNGENPNAPLKQFILVFLPGENVRGKSY